MSQSKIAFIGAGKMGLPVCKRLKAAGHDIKILARRADQARALQELGFIVENNVPDLVRGADIVFTCLPDDQTLCDVLLNETTVSALPHKAVMIDMSTVSPDISARIATHLPKGIAFLRSPVSGSTGMAESGTLTALVSGPQTAFEAQSEIFGAFSKKAFYLGAAEEARFLKLAINSMVAATSALLGEALALGVKGGLTNAAMLEVITQSAVASPLIGYKKDMIICGNYQPAATLNMLKKDLDLFLDAGRNQGVAMPINSEIHKIYSSASKRGLGEKDFFVLVEEAEKAANKKQ